MNSYSSTEMDVYNFENGNNINNDGEQHELIAELASWNPFESKPFELKMNDAKRRHTFGQQHAYAMLQKEMMANGEKVSKSTDELLKLANNFKGHSILDQIDGSRDNQDLGAYEDFPHSPIFKTVSERRLRFQQQQHEERWSWDIGTTECAPRFVSGEDRVVGRKLSYCNNNIRSTLNGGYSNAVKKSILLINANNSGSELAERRHLHHHTSVDSGFRTSTDSEYRSTFDKQTSLQRFRQLKSRSQEGSFFELSDFVDHGSPASNNGSVDFRTRARSVKRRQFVNGIHLKFIKPARQCPNWDKPKHRDEDPNCTLWHPKAKCYFYPNCRLTADLCGFAHPFCSDHLCKCPSGKQSEQLNHRTI